MKKVKVGKIDIAYQWDGLQDGPVLMMAHAMGTSHRIWDQQIGALQAKYKILRYDWRGHGSTSAPDGPYTLEEFVDDAIGTMNALGIQTVNWVGISTGGMIGQGLAIRYPERISSLVLCNTTSQSDVWYKNWVKERQAVVKDGGMPPVWEMTKALWFNDDFVARENADYCRIRDVFVKTPVAGYLGGTSAVADLAYRDKLHLIQAPTRIIAAGDDPVTPIQKSKEIQSEISNSELIIIDGQRHFSNVEVPETFNNELIRCLDQIV
jgi:3-oxoadipate enol-lactonase|tara:strand:- start:100 stop:894 length:795 start_codon:yes stop_codon:yes gene_type:complete